MEFYREIGPGLSFHFEHNLPSQFLNSTWGIAVASVLLLVLLVVLAISAATYVMQAYALYTMAQKRGLENAWLAWVPVAGKWVLGALADDINAHQGKKTNYGLLLLIVSAVSAAGGASLILLPLMGVFSVPLSLVALVLFYIVLYEIFQDYAPENAVLFLVLSILLSVSWLLLFILRNRRPVTLGGGRPVSANPAPQPTRAEQAPPAQPQPIQPQEVPPAQPLGWYPGAEQPPLSHQPCDCPPEHWGGIMMVQDTTLPDPSEQESDFSGQ